MTIGSSLNTRLIFGRREGFSLMFTQRNRSLNMGESKKRKHHGRTYYGLYGIDPCGGGYWPTWK